MKKLHSNIVRNTLGITLVITLMFALLHSCREKSIPKPAGYFRITFPEKKYATLGPGYPYRFDVPVYCVINNHLESGSELFWMNIDVPANKAQIHISYKKVEKNLHLFAEESRKLAYDHSIKASSIREEVYRDAERKVYGTIYHIEGNAASPLQFFLTDSTRHFIRGSLYIRATPRIDSLKPVIDFLKADVDRLIKTLDWTD